MLRAVQWLGYGLIALGTALYVATFFMAYLRGGITAVLDRWFTHPVGEAALLVLCVGPGMLVLGWTERRRSRSVGQSNGLSGDAGTAARDAIRSGDLDKFRVHTRLLRDLNERVAPQNWTLLHYLAAQGAETKPVHTDMAAELLQAGADVNCRTELGWTPIHMIAMGGQRQASGLARVLVAHGADLAAVDRMGADWRAHWQHGTEIRNILEEGSAITKFRG